MKVLYACNFGQGTGYARAAEDYCAALHQAGVSLEIQPLLPWQKEGLDSRGRALLPCVRGWDGFMSSGEAPTHVVLHANPRWCLEYAWDLAVQNPAAPMIAYTTWETGRAPSDLCRRLEDTFDLLLVPSRFCASAFRSGGFPADRIRRVPHCFDPTDWNEWPGREPQLAAGPPARPFTFISVLSWNARKNPAGLLRAYLTAFYAEQNVLLKLLVPSYNEADVTALKIGAQLEAYPNLEIVTRLSEIGYREFFESADCYVTATRGEGWDLPAFDAATMGLPVIAPLFGGQADYLETYERFSWVPNQLTPAILPLSPDGSGGARLIGPDFLTGLAFWAEPDLRALREAMRSLAAGWLPGWAGRRSWFEEQFSYDVVGKNFAQILEGFTK